MRVAEKIGTKGIFLLFLLAGALLTATYSFAQTSERHPVLKKFEEAGGKIDFIGNAYGMDGWIVTNPQDKVLTAYTTPEGGLIVGMLFAPDGTSETQKQLEAYHARISGNAQTAAPGAEKSDSSKSEKLYAETEKAGWVALGDSHAPYLYMFMNVNCDHCQEFWKDLSGAVGDNRLQVRLVPYGTAPANREGGAALLSADNPMAAWQAYVSGDKTALAKEKAKDDAFAKIDANTAMVKAWNLSGPPFTLYRKPGDGTLAAVVGRPENPMLLMAEFLK